MVRKGGFFDVEERLALISVKGDDLARLAAVVDFEGLRPELERAVLRRDGAKGDQPPFDHVLMFKVLSLQGMAVCPSWDEWLSHPMIWRRRDAREGRADPQRKEDEPWRTIAKHLSRSMWPNAVTGQFGPPFGRFAKPLAFVVES